MQSKFDPAEKLILALDGMQRKEVFSLIAQIPELRWVKIGLELFTSCGPAIISDLRELGLSIFLDLKFHDIPVTMAGACREAAKYGAQLITVHACAGKKALVASHISAMQGAEEVNLPPPILLGVTILTSWEEKQFAEELSINQRIDVRANMLAELAYNAGLGGCVCSPEEVENLRFNFPEPFQYHLKCLLHLNSG